MKTKIPVTVITGFLGAGKTTMIRNLLMQAEGRRIALVINEFGDLGVDGDLLKSCGAQACRDDDIIELTNGCICCTVADDFIPTMEKLIDSDALPDHIVIETSGLALPQPLIAAFNWPGIRERVSVDGVITVVDSPAVAAGRFADDHARLERERRADEALDHESPLEELFEDQLSAADLVILNKADLLHSGAMAQVRDAVLARAPRSFKLIEAHQGSVPATVLLGLGVGSQQDIANRKSHHQRQHEGAGDEDHDHDHDHDHDEFDSFIVELTTLQDPAAFVMALEALIEAHDILRVKGFVDVAGKPMRMVVQAVGSRVDSYFDRPWSSAETRATRLVVIGEKGLDRAVIQREIAALIAPEALGAA